MSEIVVVTTWSPEQEAVYGEEFRRGFKEHVKGTYLVVVPQNVIENGRDWLAFEEHLEIQQNAKPHVDWKHPLWDARKFAYKVFAMTDPLLPADGFRVWIDGDVTFHGTPDWETLLPREGEALTYLARPWFTYPETGFLGWRMPEASAALAYHRQQYVTGELFTDTRGFGDGVALVRTLERVPIKARSLCPLEPIDPDRMHVWPKSPLQRSMSHHKGLGRKQAAYGRYA